MESLFFNVHSGSVQQIRVCSTAVMSFPKDIKRILSDCILWPGISINDFKDLVKDSSLSCFDPDELWQEYSKIQEPKLLEYIT